MEHICKICDKELKKYKKPIWSESHGFIYYEPCIHTVNFMTGEIREKTNTNGDS